MNRPHNLVNAAVIVVFLCAGCNANITPVTPTIPASRTPTTILNPVTLKVTPPVQSPNQTASPTSPVAGRVDQTPAALEDSAYVPEGYQLVWQDEFSGSTIDSTKWEIMGDWPRRLGWWFQDFAYTSGQGDLVIKTDKKAGLYHQTIWGTIEKNTQAPADWEDAYGSGAIRTKGKFYHRFGYYEARVKFVGDRTRPGHWPAFWIFGETVGNVGNDGKDGTEIDIFEYWQNNDVSHGLAWDGYGSDHQAKTKHVRIRGLGEGYHVFGLLWTPTEYVFYVDGKETWRTNAGGVSQVAEYIKITDEIAQWYGDISKVELPQYMLVDYVRVYAEPGG